MNENRHYYISDFLKTLVQTTCPLWEAKTPHWGIDAMILNHDSVIGVIRRVAQKEKDQ